MSRFGRMSRICRYHVNVTGRVFAFRHLMLIRSLSLSLLLISILTIENFEVAKSARDVLTEATWMSSRALYIVHTHGAGITLVFVKCVLAPNL